MNITFTTTNGSFQLAKVGSVALVTYAVIGATIVVASTVHYAEKAFVAYKRRINRKINAK
jgi:hypothetical protein